MDSVLHIMIMGVRSVSADTRMSAVACERPIVRGHALERHTAADAIENVDRAR